MTTAPSLESIERSADGQSLGETAQRQSTEDKRTRGGLLSGIRVLDLTRLLPGAYCTQMLADFGAEIIKIEQPGKGDYWRWASPRVNQQSVQFLALNRGKRSITLNLKDAAGREAFLRLCDTADVVIEGFRPGVMERLGLSFDTLIKRNPKLVVCAMTGFGQEGPWKDVAAHDLNYLGMAGLLQITKGKTENLSPTGLPIGDIGGGSLMALTGILAALNDVARTGRGHVIDVSVLDGLFSWVGFMAAGWNAPGHEEVDIPFDAPFDKPFYSVYETRDGRHMVTGAYEEKFWRTLCRALDRPDWIDHQWTPGAKEDEIRQGMAGAFKSKTQAEWIEIFAQNEACVTPVHTTREALGSEHALCRDSMIEIDDPVEGKLRHVGNPLRVDGKAQNATEPAPLLGSDTHLLLEEIGYTPRQIAEMEESQAI